MGLIDGDLVPSSSGTSHLGVEARGASNFDISKLKPFGHIHQLSGVFHNETGTSGILRLGTSLFEISINGGETFLPLLPAMYVEVFDAGTNQGIASPTSIQFDTLIVSTHPASFDWTSADSITFFEPGNYEASWHITLFPGDQSKESYVSCYLELNGSEVNGTRTHASQALASDGRSRAVTMTSSWLLTNVNGGDIIKIIAEDVAAQTQTQEPNCSALIVRKVYN